MSTENEEKIEIKEEPDGSVVVDLSGTSSGAGIFSGRSTTTEPSAPP